MILRVRIRLLDSRFHGRGDDGAPEWPPSPMRLFQAIVAGVKPKWHSAYCDALEWLETLDPPVIHAPVYKYGKPYRTFVPVNNSGSGDVDRTPKEVRPLILPSDCAVVDYLWNFVQVDEVRAKVAIDASRHIRALGWGVDMAIGNGEILTHMPVALPECSEFFPYLKNEISGCVMRVPRPGSLSSLEKQYASDLNRLRDGAVHDEPGLAVSNTCSYATSPFRPFCVYALRSLVEEDQAVSFDPRYIKAVVGMVRGLLGSERVRDQLGNEVVNKILLGHAEEGAHPRLSILPLLSVGHRHADARVRRVMLAEPFGGSGDICRTLAGLLNGQLLIPSDGKRAPSTCLIRLPHDDRYVRRWFVCSAREWASVSSVVLPGFDNRRDRRRTGFRIQKCSTTNARAEKLVMKALSHAGIAQSCTVEFGEISWWPGVPHAREFVPRDKLGPAPRYHVKLTFEKSFTGPLSLGRQRHMGLGVFAALDSFNDIRG